MRVLLAAHSHPRLTHGGGEIAAWRLFEALAARPGGEAWFLGCAQEAPARSGRVITQPFGAREFLYAASAFDWFRFANRDPLFPGEMADLLRATRPDVVHFHHYLCLGVETFRLVKEVLPAARIALTLHEFQAICAHYGQMVKNPSLALCEEWDVRACQRCFPGRRSGEFFLRRAYVQRFFSHVDRFIAPSQFLAARYAAWGVPEAKLRVVENLTAAATPATGGEAEAEAAMVAGTRPLIAGFFGQTSQLKGIMVLMEAARLLEAAGAPVAIEIHGDHANQPEQFKREFIGAIGDAGSNIRYHGAYDNRAVDRLMRGVDVVVVPSIWWENAPVVIEEALRNHRPVICADIGGMAEAVRPGLDGLHFPTGSPAGLAAVLSGLAAEPGRLAGLRATLRRPAAPEQTLARHLALYQEMGAG